MFAGGLVGKFGEFADKFLEDRAHLGVAYGLGVEVDGGEFFGDEVEQPGFGEAVNLGVKLETRKDVAHGGRESLQISAKIFGDVILVAHELLQVERRGVVKELAGFTKKEWLDIDAGFLALGQFGQDGGLGLVQHAIETAENGEREDDLTVVGLFVVAAKKIGYGPDERGKIGIGHE